MLLFLYSSISVQDLLRPFFNANTAIRFVGYLGIPWTSPGKSSTVPFGSCFGSAYAQIKLGAHVYIA
jgi:hypothetical protein